MTVGVILALVSALAWGSGDFFGGRAATRHDGFQVLYLAALSGIALLLVAALLAGEHVAPDPSLWFAVGAGVAGAAGIVSLYRGLAVGRAAVVAPTAAVVTAAIPVVFAAVSDGMPGALRLFGFALALMGIFLVTRTAGDATGSLAGLRLGVLAGIGFGLFLILVARGQSHAVFVPLAVARAMMLLAAMVVMSARRTRWPALGENRVALLAGALDAAGNVFYLLAQQQVRLDVAAVLSSLYPVATVLLARMILRDAVTPLQWLGVGVCLVAVAAIAG